MKTSEIQLKIQLDDDKIPSKITWESTDQQQKTAQEVKAFMLSMFDKDHKDTLRIDLWTKDMQVQEMDRMFFYTLRGMADTYMRATNNKELAEHMKQFTHYFGEKTGIVKEEGTDPTK